MDLKCSMMLPLVGSSHLCDIHVHSCGIFNHFDSRKTSKAAFSLSQGPASWVLALGSQEWALAWFIVSTNGFKRNIWAWSSEKSLSPGFLWWHSKKTSGRHETPFERKSRAPPRDVSRRVSLLINRHISSACSVKSRVFETKGEKRENTN